MQLGGFNNVSEVHVAAIFRVTKKKEKKGKVVPVLK
jgi:hypothetical protein